MIVWVCIAAVSFFALVSSMVLLHVEHSERHQKLVDDLAKAAVATKGRFADLESLSGNMLKAQSKRMDDMDVLVSGLNKAIIRLTDDAVSFKGAVRTDFDEVASTIGKMPTRAEMLTFATDLAAGLGKRIDDIDMEGCASHDALSEKIEELTHGLSATTDAFQRLSGDVVEHKATTTEKLAALSDATNQRLEAARERADVHYMEITRIIVALNRIGAGISFGRIEEPGSSKDVGTPTIAT